MTIRDMLPLVSDAEKKGFEIAFFSETSLTFRDAISSHSAFALNTSKIKLGCTQVVRLRTPLVIAQTFATLDELSNRRIILSLGACTNSHARKHGLHPQNPAQVLREHTAVIRQYWKNAMGSVNFEGETIRVEGEGLGFGTMRQIPIWIAATSNTGLKIAGEIGDGVLLNATTSPEYVRNAVRIVQKAAKDAGRDCEKIEIAGIIVSAVSDNESEAVKSVRWELASKFAPLQVDFAIRPRLRVGEPCINEQLIDNLLASYKQGGTEKLSQDIPDAVIHELTAVGTAMEVRKRIDTYRDMGIRLPIVRPANQKVSRATLDAVAPN